jgi:MazG family protein
MPHDELRKLEEFIAIVRRLRTECPWDREQTHDSIRAMLLEEAHEVMESIESGDLQELSKELGDILLHVVMHSVIAEESGAFTLADVVDREAKKLVHRHPHVFGETAAANAEEVKKNWERLKMEEGGRESVVDGVPRTLPSLARAERVQMKAAKAGFDWPSAEPVFEKIREEIEELRHEVDSGAPRERLEAELGDLLFAVVNYARWIKVNPEDALRHTTDRFMRRFKHIEQRLGENGKTVFDSTLEEMDRFWEEAKSEE